MTSPCLLSRHENADGAASHLLHIPSLYFARALLFLPGTRRVFFSSLAFERVTNLVFTRKAPCWALARLDLLCVMLVYVLLSLLGLRDLP